MCPARVEGHISGMPVSDIASSGYMNLNGLAVSSS